MLETIKHRYRLSRLFCEKRRLQNAYTARIREAGKSVGASDARRDLISEAAFEQGLVDDSINMLVTRHLLRQADRLFVPVPDYVDQKMWTETTGGDRRVLTPLGISTLRAAVRAELGQRRESLLKLLAALTGIIGAATGFTLGQQFGPEVRPAFERYMQNASLQRRRSMCRVLAKVRGDWSIDLLAPLLQDTRPAEGWTYAVVPGKNEPRLPIRICGEAAQTIAQNFPRLAFKMAGEHRDLDRQINVIRDQIAHHEY